MNIVDGVISEDTDTIACGSKLVLREFSNRDDTVIVYDINNILYDLNLNQNSFVDLCILLGNDYNNRVKGFIVDKIYELVLKFKSIENILNNNIIKYLNFDYKSIRKIFNLENIKPNIIKISSQIYNKKFKLLETIKFLEEKSSIDSKTFKHRLHLIYNSNDKLPRKNCLLNIKSNCNTYQIEFDRFQCKQMYL